MTFENDTALLLTLRASPSIERERLEKIVYLLQEKYGVPFGYPFIKHYHGPQSYELRSDILSLIFVGCVKERFVEGTGFLNALTKEGKEYIDGKEDKEIDAHVSKLKRLHTKKLIDLSYEVYEKGGRHHD